MRIEILCEYDDGRKNVGPVFYGIGSNIDINLN